MHKPCVAGVKPSLLEASTLFSQDQITYLTPMHTHTHEQAHTFSDTYSPRGRIKKAPLWKVSSPGPRFPSHTSPHHCGNRDNGQCILSSSSLSLSLSPSQISIDWNEIPLEIQSSHPLSFPANLDRPLMCTCVAVCECGSVGMSGWERNWVSRSRRDLSPNSIWIQPRPLTLQCGCVVGK